VKRLEKPTSVNSGIRKSSGTKLENSRLNLTQIRVTRNLRSASGRFQFQSVKVLAAYFPARVHLLRGDFNAAEISIEISLPHCEIENRNRIHAFCQDLRIRESPLSGVSVCLFAEHAETEESGKKS
jgi:hypothetical protein